FGTLDKQIGRSGAVRTGRAPVAARAQLGGSARVLSDVFITQRDASCRRNRSRLADSSGRSTTGARSLVGAKRGAIVVRHQATWSLLERSIHEIYQASRHNQTLQPTLGISFASRGSGVQIPSAPPSSCRSET